MVAAIMGFDLKSTAIDALLYKNWFWWGLDLIADGLVLIFVAGTWYLLAMMISGKPLFMQNIARAALLVELVVSWTVWSHHLLSDQAQPAILKVVSGEMVTAFELITQGLAFFITLATLWSARPLKMTNPLKFLLGGLLGFALAVPAGIMQADVGLNRDTSQYPVGSRTSCTRGNTYRIDNDSLFRNLSSLPYSYKRSKSIQSETCQCSFLVPSHWRCWNGSIYGHGRTERYVKTFSLSKRGVQPDDDTCCHLWNLAFNRVFGILL